ncbi:MAG: LYR motif-containing protein [Planctomycetaceae bacterium]|nr:LYR motif-containing protein [Planctomycetaceae bacterium]
MKFSRNDAFDCLVALDVATVFLDSYRGKKLPENLDSYFGPPEEFFVAADTQEPYTDGELIPILDDGNFSVVTFCDPLQQHFVQYFVESPKSPINKFLSWQQYLADLLIHVGESMEDDERVRRVASIVGFQNSDLLFKFFAAAEDGSYDEYMRLRDEFVHGIHS